MPEPVTTLTVTAVALYLADKAGGKFVEKAAESLWDKFTNMLAGDEIITLFPKVSDSPLLRQELTAKIDTCIQKDPALKAEVEDLYKQLPQEMKDRVVSIVGDGNIVNSTVDNRKSVLAGDLLSRTEGDQNVSFAGINESKIDLDQSTQINNMGILQLVVGHSGPKTKAKNAQLEVSLNKVRAEKDVLDAEITKLKERYSTVSLEIFNKSNELNAITVRLEAAQKEKCGIEERIRDMEKDASSKNEMIKVLEGLQ